MTMFEQLAAEFPREAVHWRAQSLTSKGDKAMALAYIDARNVMERLDQVCGPANWQDSYTETPKGRLICTLSINVDGQWINKSDGAGNTDVEGDKGAISDALKRAAVKWGIGRYLYDVETPWVPCESYEKNGKRHWRKWTASPWDYVKATPKPDPIGPINDKTRDWLSAQIDAHGTTVQALCARFAVPSLKQVKYEQIGEVRQWLSEQKENA